MSRVPDEEHRADAEVRKEKRDAAEHAAQNPRSLIVDTTTLQRRRGIAAQLLEYYRFLTSLYLPAEALKIPHQDGWDFINAERFAFLGKSDAVIDLYKHIPYISDEEGGPYQIDIHCQCFDHVGRRFRTGFYHMQSVSFEPDQYYEHMDGQPT